MSDDREPSQEVQLAAKEYIIFHLEKQAREWKFSTTVFGISAVVELVAIVILLLQLSGK